jgi:hypothetical protein
MLMYDIDRTTLLYTSRRREEEDCKVTSGLIPTLSRPLYLTVWVSFIARLSVPLVYA